mgnify:CR=1 FL=1
MRQVQHFINGAHVAGAGKRKGDIYNPNTTGGRALTVILIIAGMVLIGVFTATLTSILVRDDSDSTREELSDLLDVVRELKHNQDHVMEQLDVTAPSSEEDI